MRKKSFWIRVIGSGFISIVGILIMFFFNFSIINDLVVKNYAMHDSECVENGAVFNLFYTISSGTGYHAEPSYLNFIFTALIGMVVGGFTSYKLIWKNRNGMRHGRREQPRGF
jgi:hypothetical protein